VRYSLLDCEKRHVPNKPIGTTCAMTHSRRKRLRLERLTALDGLPSEWGERWVVRDAAGWRWVAITKAVSRYSPAGGAGGKCGRFWNYDKLCANRFYHRAKEAAK